MTTIPEDVTKAARGVVAQRFTNMRDHDFAGWVIDGTANPYPTYEVNAVARAILAERTRCEAEKAAAIAEAVAAERERCAKIIINWKGIPFSTWRDLAAAIRKGE